MFKTFKNRNNNYSFGNILTRAKDYGHKAGQLLGNVEKVYRKLEHEIPQKYRTDIDKGLKTANDYTNTFNRVVNAF